MAATAGMKKKQSHCMLWPYSGFIKKIGDTPIHRRVRIQALGETWARASMLHHKAYMNDFKAI